MKKCSGGCALGAALACLVFVLCGPAVAAQTKSYRFGVWRLQMTHDTFTGDNTCRMKSYQMRYADHVLSFRFDGHIDADAAVFRINGGPIDEAAKYEGAVKSAQLFYDPRPLDHLGDPRVLLPESLFDNAVYIDIRPNPKALVHHFRLDGLRSALAFMREHDCSAPSED